MGGRRNRVSELWTRSRFATPGRADSVQRLVLIWISASALTLIALVCWTQVTDPQFIDFISLWAAGSLTVAGDPLSAYDIAAHKAVEDSVIPSGGMLPFPYPPPFLLLVAPFGFLSFGPAFVLWIITTGAFYIWSSQRRLAALVLPSVPYNAMIGQTGYLVAGFFIAGLKLLAARPALGGAVLGLLVIKPQIAFLIPVALLAGRQWRAMFGAAFSAVSIMLIGAMVFGVEAYSAWLRMLSVYSDFLATEMWSWDEVASTYALARFFGSPSVVAMVIHCTVAAAAVFAVWMSWMNNHEHKASILAASSLLISPYLMSYDFVLLTLAFGTLLAGSCIAGFTLWLFCLPPLLSTFAIYEGPNTLPFAAIGAVVVLCRSSGSGNWNGRRQATP